MALERWSLVHLATVVSRTSNLCLIFNNLQDWPLAETQGQQQNMQQTPVQERKRRKEVPGPACRDLVTVNRVSLPSRLVAMLQSRSACRGGTQ